MPPALVRRLLLPLHERLLGRRTIDRLAEIERTQWCSPDELADRRVRALRRLLQHAAQRVPFYSAALADAGVDPSRATLDDLAQLPTLTKADIRANLERLTDPSIPGGLHRCATGGSTGEPLHFFTDRSRQAADQAARARTRRWFGIEPGDRELYLWGSPIENSAQNRLKRVRDRLFNQRLLNAFEMTPARTTRYLADIRRFDPVHLFGYPSSLAALASAARETRGFVPNPSLRAVFVTGELLDPADRRMIASCFGAPVVNGYGAREAGFIAHECPAGGMHVTSDSLIVELLDDGGRPVAPGESGEIVVTHLEAFGMPFIRYRTGDGAALDDRPCPCGRRFPMLRRIEGRRTDLLRRADGGHAHALSVIYVLREMPAVRQFKVRQRRNLDLDVLLVPAGPFDADARRRVVEGLARQLGGVSVHLALTDRIPPDASGKHRCVTAEA